MEPVLTPEAMDEADRRTIAAGTPVDVLMERAGRAVAWEVRRVAHGTLRAARRASCAARATTAATGSSPRACSRAGACGPACSSSPTGSTTSRSTRALADAHVAVDAMFGTGFRGALEGDAALVAEQLAAWDGPTVAVDIPSGVDGLRGLVARAHRARRPARSPSPRASPVWCSSPGARTPARSWSPTSGSTSGPGRTRGLVTDDDVRAWLPPPGARRAQVAVGGDGRRRLGRHDRRADVREPRRDAGRRRDRVVRVARGRRRARRLRHRGDHAPAARHAERRPGPERGGAGAGGDRPVRRARASVPGSGPTRQVGLAVRALVAEARAPLVLDADGLNALAGDFAAFDARRTLGAPAVLTPHTGEYERLMGRPVGDDRIAAACALAERSGAVVLLKGPGTVVAAPGGRGGAQPDRRRRARDRGQRRRAHRDRRRVPGPGDAARSRRRRRRRGCTGPPPTGWWRPTAPASSPATSSGACRVRCRPWEWPHERSVREPGIPASNGAGASAPEHTSERRGRVSGPQGASLRAGDESGQA